MPAGLLTMTFPANSGDSADDIVWTYAVVMPAGYDPGATVDVLTEQWALAISAVNGTGLSLAERLSPAYDHINGPGAIVGKLYDITAHLDGSPHGSPVGMNAVNIALANGDAALPAEVAVVLTLRAFDWQDQPVETPDGPDPGFAPDRPRSRYSGRQFIGPLGSGVMTQDVNLQAEVKTDFRTDLLDFAERLYDAWSAQDLYWAIWSRSDETLRTVSEAKVDNAFDTIRVRGKRPSTSNSRVLNP